MAEKVILESVQNNTGDIGACELEDDLFNSFNEQGPVKQQDVCSPETGDFQISADEADIVRALKQLQLKCTQIEVEFYKEVHQLECKYSALYAPHFQMREKLLNGKIDLPDKDCENFEDISDNILSAESATANANSATNDGRKKGTGIPGFWLTALKNVEMLRDMIQPHDEPILLFLSNIAVIFRANDPMGFDLDFHFKPNEYFENSVLTKKYEMKCVMNESDPFLFDGPEIYRCEGCKINWKPDKDVTVRNITKKQKHRNSGSVRIIKKTVINDSFFNYFNPPTLRHDTSTEEIDFVTQDILAADFEIGHFIRERFIPRAVLFYTGEAVDLDEDLDCEGEEEDYIDGEELEEEEEEDDEGEGE